MKHTNCRHIYKTKTGTRSKKFGTKPYIDDSFKYLKITMNMCTKFQFDITFLVDYLTPKLKQELPNGQTDWRTDAQAGSLNCLLSTIWQRFHYNKDGQNEEKFVSNRASIWREANLNFNIFQKKDWVFFVADCFLFCTNHLLHVVQIPLYRIPKFPLVHSKLQYNAYNISFNYYIYILYNAVLLFIFFNNFKNIVKSKRTHNE